jgi:hypothetical protein
MKHVLLIFSFLIVSASFIYAGQCTAITNGNWNTPGTWSCGRVPASNDTLTIPAGFTVTVDINSPTYVHMYVKVYGVLNFGNGQKLNMCPGFVEVFAGGELSGGTPGSKINICGTTVWNGPGPTYGYITYGDLPLPVELTAFTGEQKDNVNFLNWSTATETNNSHFIIERSVNGMSFEEVGKVEGNGTSSQPHSYTLVDEHPGEGTNYYRLTQYDFNGASETFPIISVDYRSTIGGCVLSVNPNPCEESCVVTFTDCPADNNGIIQLDLIDANGNTVSSQVPQRNAQGGFTTVIDTQNNLAPGVYIVRGTSSKTAYQKKAILK